MPSRSISLHHTLVVAFVAVGVLAAVGAACLIFLTTLLHRSSRSLAETLEGIRLAEKIESSILLMDRADDLAAAGLAADLRERLFEMRTHVSGAEEVNSFRRTDGAIEGYLQARRDPNVPGDVRAARLREAYSEIVALIDINIAQARAAEAEASRWDGRADAIGLVVLALTLAIVTLLVWHLNTQAFRPVFVLSDAIDRFAHGDYGARATPEGPTELQQLARRFNAMADTLTRQRDNRLAFLSGVAHDLRNPLSVINMSVEVLAATEEQTPARSEWLQRVRRQLRRLTQMTADFMDAAQIEAGKFELKLEVVDARTLVLRSVDLFNGSSPRHHLEVDVPGDAIPVTCDPHRVEQVLVNLVGNAIKYSPKGGTVRVETRASGREAIFAVSDQGIGLSAEEVDTIFEPFRRTGHLQADVPGAGLGLSIVRRIIEAHRGQVEVDSEPGRGSTFRFRLALAPATALPQPPGLPEETPAR